VANTVVIHQPDFLSHLGFFHRFLQADLWVVLDNVQFVSGTSRSWQNRDKIKTPKGERWITVGVQKCPLGTEIRAVQLARTGWREDNLNLIRANYGQTPCFGEIMPYLEALYARQDERLMDFTLASVDMLLELFEIRIDRLLASDLAPQGRSNELLVDIIRKTGAQSYLSGLGARGYFDPAPFDAAGIKVLWQDFVHPVYPQLHGPFIPELSSIDLLFNCGIQRSREILRSTA